MTRARTTLDRRGRSRRPGRQLGLALVLALLALASAACGRYGPPMRAGETEAAPPAPAAVEEEPGGARPEGDPWDEEGSP